MARRNDRAKQRSLAEERINRLFELAIRHAGTEGNSVTGAADATFCATCVKHARTLAMKYRIRIKKPYN
ncbi:MAG: hypothetical protein J6X83_07040, partial [Methanomicrobium sp.]|nr:hypothetical protein [Methanomicrobium sp.]